MRLSVPCSLLAFGVLLLSAVTVFATETGVDRKATQVITKEKVWNADRQLVQMARQRCVDLEGRQADECFAEAMKDLGASDAAVSFTRSFGSGVFVRRFREVGRIGVAQIVRPFRTNEPTGVLLVNGDPPIVDVDDLALLPKETMEQDKVYGSVKKVFPRVTLWPGDRSMKYPSAEPLPEGGSTFTVPYSLRNSCHTCEIVGTAFFAFDFDREGRLMNVRFLRVDLPAKKPMAKADNRKESEQIRFIVMTEEGKEFTVKLESNRTTGYQWRPAEPFDERVIRAVRSEYTPFDMSMIGSGGEESWTFYAVGKGDAEVVMEYVRPWEKGQPPLKTATIKVSVKPASQR